MGFKFEVKLFEIEVEGKTFKSVNGMNVSQISKELESIKTKINELTPVQQADGRETAKILRGSINRIFGKGAYDEMFKGFDPNDVNLQLQLVAYITTQLVEQQAQENKRVQTKYLGLVK